MNKTCTQTIATAILMASILSCGSRTTEKSYLSASSYPDSCTQSAYFEPFMGRLETCNSPQLDAASAEFCLASIRPIYENLPADCRQSMDTRELVGRAVKVFTKNGVKNSLAIATAAQNPDYKGTGGLTYLWLKDYGFLYANSYELTPEIISARLGREYALSEVTAEILKSVQTLATKQGKEDAEAKTKLPLDQQKLIPVNQITLRQYVGILKDGFENYKESKEGPLFTAFVMSQILKSLQADFTSLASLQDMACSLTTCSNSGKYPLVLFTNLIAAIPDTAKYADAYQVALDNNAFSDPNSPAALFFKVVKQHPDKVRAAFTSCFDKLEIAKLLNNNLLAVNLESYVDASFVAKDFLETIKAFQAKAQKFKKSGYLANQTEGSVSYPFNLKLVEDIQLFLGKAKTEIESKVSNYSASRLSLLQTLNTALNDVSQKIDNSKLIESYTNEVAQIGQDIAGLQNAIKTQEDSLAEYTQQLDSLTDKVASKNQYVTIVEPQFTVSAAESKFSVKGLSSAVPADYAIRTMDLKAGEILNVDVLGQWSPTCALRSFPSGIPLDNPTADISSIVTSSEGYTIGFSTGNSAVKTLTTGEREVSYKDQSATASLCAKASMSGAGAIIGSAAGAYFGGPAGAAAGKEIGGKVGEGFEASACGNVTKGKRNEDFSEETDSSSQTLGNTANFSSGLRLPSTPFVDYAAGSLLVFAVDAANPNDFAARAVEVKVLGARNSIVADRDLKLYFVINDCADGNAAASKLTVMPQRVVTAKAELKSAQAKLMSIVSSFRNKAAKSLLEGTEISDQLNVLKANASVEAAVVTDALNNVSDVRELFDYWLDHEALQVKRMASIEQKRRDATRLIGEVQRMVLKDEGLKANAVIRQLQIKYELDNLDNKVLVDPIARIADKVTREFAAPTTFFFSKEKLTAKIGTPAAELVSQLTIDSPFVDAAKKTAAFIEAFNIETENWSKRLESNENVTTVALRFPHPFRSQLDIDTNLITGKYEDSLSYLPTAPESLSRSVWEGIFVASSPARPTIRPDMNAMFADAAEGYLQCSSSSPIIEDTAFMFVSSLTNTTMDVLRSMSKNASLSVYFGPTTVIPTNSGLTEFNLDIDGGNLLGSQMKVGFVSLGEAALGNFDDGIMKERDTNSGAGRGLSPFTPLDIGFSSLYNFFQRPERASTFGVKRQALGDIKFTKDSILTPIPLNGYEIPQVDKSSFPTDLSDIIVVYRVRTLPASKASMKYLRACSK